ncbi:MAG TPA: hypothetical protein VKB29_04250 [Candidatus Binataceae bacterium]|nr:hypothetical protein [Candidatus Binataceae bacterium]
MKRVTILFFVGAMLLVGAASVPTFRAVAQSAAVTDDNLSQSIANAKTAADHEAIAAYYDQEAADAKKKADLHRNVADTYQKLNIAKPVGMVNMCKGLVKYWDKVADQAKDLAKAHREMAKAAGGVG